MLQDIPTSTLREAGSCVPRVRRLTLQRPTLADVELLRISPTIAALRKTPAACRTPISRPCGRVRARNRRRRQRDGVSDRTELFADRHGRHRPEHAGRARTSAIGSALSIGARGFGASKPRGR